MKKIILLSFCLFLLGTFVFSAEAQNTSSLRLVDDSSGFSFRKDLLLGDTDPDVKELQKILNSSVDTAVSFSGPGSSGQESNYFGNLTKLAVIKFQEKYRGEILTPVGLASGNGNVGFSTRKKLNLLLGVTETWPSVGYPQSRSAVANQTNNSVITTISTTTSPVAVIQVNNGIQTPMSVCQFVEFLIGIQAITPNKVTLARQALSCPTPSLVHNFDDDSESNSTATSLTVTCSPNSPIINLGNYITWTASTTGNTGSYTYSWSGTDGLTGNTQSVSHLYNATSSVGLHNAKVTVTSGSKTASSTCLAAVNAVSPNSPAVSALPVTVDIEAIPAGPNKYLITWSSTQATSCTAFSSPNVSGWNNQKKSLNGVENLTVSQTGMLRLVCSNNTYSNFDAVIVNFTPPTPPEEEEEEEAPAESASGGPCVYLSTCYAPVNLPFDQDFTFEIHGNVGILPDCWGPDLWLSGSASSPFFELFQHKNGIGFNLAHQTFFTEAIVGGIIEGVDPAEAPSGYTNLGSLAPGLHSFRVEYSYSSGQVKYYEDGELIAHLLFETRGQPESVEKLRIPPWFPALFAYRVGPVVEGESLFDLNGNPAGNVSAGGCH